MDIATWMNSSYLKVAVPFLWKSLCWNWAAGEEDKQWNYYSHQQFKVTGDPLAGELAKHTLEDYSPKANFNIFLSLPNKISSTLPAEAKLHDPGRYFNEALPLAYSVCIHNPL